MKAISQIAKESNIISLTDNTWATAIGQNCFKFGIDVVIESFTKYVVGHSDVMMGGIIANAEYLDRIKKQTRIMGQCCGPDDVYLALRGLRTMELRLNKSFQSSLVIAEWLSKNPYISKVIHPAREDHPDNAIFQRDYCLGAGLFSIELKTKKSNSVDAFIDELNLFGVGASWGGYESLILEAELEEAASQSDGYAFEGAELTNSDIVNLPNGDLQLTVEMTASLSQVEGRMLSTSSNIYDLVARVKIPQISSTGFGFFEIISTEISSRNSMYDYDLEDEQ